MNLQKNVSLQAYNTFGITCFAKHFTAIHQVEQLQNVITSNKQLEEKILIIGGGSNLLLTQNFDGWVLYNNLKGIEKIAENPNHVWIKAAGGEVWHELVLYCLANDWAGIENLSLIPGSVGAAPIQNIGAYGVELKDVFHSLEATHLQTGEQHYFDHADCAFGYRDSIFKRKLKGVYFITSVTFKLNKTPIFNTSYGAIQRILENMKADEISIQTVSQAICKIRQSKLPDPKTLGNCGSFFKNPEVDRPFFDQLYTQYPQMPYYLLANDKVKIPAAWLIQQCGWKGKRRGDAGIYKNHALVLVNYGTATGSELKQLAMDVQASVQERFGITLYPEVNIL